MKVLVTGGAGYIGSHTLLELLRQEHDAVVLDNFCNSSPEALQRVKRLANRSFETITADIRNETDINAILETVRPDLVIHFAGLKAVGESVEKPLDYYETNAYGSIRLLKAMDRVGCKNIVFSSTATVYGTPVHLPYDEAHRLAPENPYGQSKLMVEHILRDWCATGQGRTGISLRYFNPVGAHESHEIGEDPQGIPNNLMPYIQQVAVGRRPFLTIHGNDYDTPDGTGVRDYIHVMDLARAHLAAVDFAKDQEGMHYFNLGCGQGHTVMEVIQAFEKQSGIKIPYQMGPRRPGDVASSFANPTKAQSLLNWHASQTLDEMCASAWGFQNKNPNGYQET